MYNRSVTNVGLGFSPEGYFSYHHIANNDTAALGQAYPALREPEPIGLVTTKCHGMLA